MKKQHQWRIYIVKFWTRGPPEFFQFHAVFGKIWQNRMLAPPLESWRPLLGEILDLPLNTDVQTSMYAMYVTVVKDSLKKIPYCNC